MAKAQKIRLDELLVRREMAQSIEKAQALCLAGQVVVDGQRIDRGSIKVPEQCHIRLKKNPYVSRGGEKLAGALKDFELTTALSGKTVLDVGASTGGFTDCALQHGATQVIALDVGTSQLAWSLRQDERVISLEKTHIKDFHAEDHPPADLIVADISFNSLARLAPYIAKAVSNQDFADLVLMVKPQFELDQRDIPQGGVVIDAALRQKAVMQVIDAFLNLGFLFESQADSRLAGRDGNIEIFIHLKKAPPNNRG